MSTPTKTSTVSCSSDTCARKPRSSNTNCSQRFCKECCIASTVRCRISAHNPPPSSIATSSGGAVAPPQFAGPYGKMISPDYAFKIAMRDHLVVPSTRMQTEAYRMEAQITIKAKYWVTNVKGPITFSAPVPNYPWWHPKDCITITDRLNLPCEAYERLDTTDHLLATTSEESDEWITSRGPIKVKPDMTLYLREPGVDTCLGLRPLRKRVLSDPQESGPSSSTPSPSKRGRTSQIITDVDNSDDEQVTLPPSSRSPSLTHQSSSSSLLQPDTPHGKRSPFPLAFAVDMDAGFRQAKELLKDGKSAKQQFDTVFGFLDIPFKSSTYSNNWKAWKASPDAVAKAVALGHHPGGEWAPIVTAIIAAHRGREMRQVHTTKAQALRTIQQSKIPVDWEFALGNKNDENRAVDNLIRKYLLEGVLVRPPGIETPLSSAPSSPQIVKPMELDNKPEDKMDVDNPLLGEKSKSGAIDVNLDLDQDTGGMHSLGIEDGLQFYAALDAGPLDKDWMVQAMIKDCTKDPRNPLTFFAEGAEIPLEVYGPDDSNCCLFTKAESVINALDSKALCPLAPWDAWWCLAGYRFLEGPFARRHNDMEDVQYDTSKAKFRDIPVTGPQQALRIMIVFKHPHDIGTDVPGFQDTELEVEDFEAINQIQPYLGPDAVKMEDDSKPIPPKGKSVSAETTQKNNEMNEFLIEFLTPLRPAVAELRETHVSAKNGGTPAQNWRWIQEIRYLKETYPRATMVGAPSHLRGKRIGSVNWAIVIARSATFFSTCVNAFAFIDGCKNEADIAKFLAVDDRTKKGVGVDTMQKLISTKAWNQKVFASQWQEEDYHFCYYRRPTRKPTERQRPQKHAKSAEEDEASSPLTPASDGVFFSLIPSLPQRHPSQPLPPPYVPSASSPTRRCPSHQHIPIPRAPRAPGTAASHTTAIPTPHRRPPDPLHSPAAPTPPAPTLPPPSISADWRAITPGGAKVAVHHSTAHACAIVYDVGAIRLGLVEGEPVVMGEKPHGGSIDIAAVDLPRTTLGSEVGVGVGVRRPPSSPLTRPCTTSPLIPLVSLHSISKASRASAAGTAATSSSSTSLTRSVRSWTSSSPSASARNSGPTPGSLRPPLRIRSGVSLTAWGPRSVERQELSLSVPPPCVPIATLPTHSGSSLDRSAVSTLFSDPVTAAAAPAFRALLCAVQHGPWVFLSKIHAVFLSMESEALKFMNRSPVYMGAGIANVESAGITSMPRHALPRIKSILRAQDSSAISTPPIGARCSLPPATAAAAAAAPAHHYTPYDISRWYTGPFTCLPTHPPRTHTGVAHPQSIVVPPGLFFIHGIRCTEIHELFSSMESDALRSMHNAATASCTAYCRTTSHPPLPVVTALPPCTPCEP
ncbi:hypothetical protein B0H11DRAFT_2233038 [Mycena galericulata]|nr:hypothetical protein B0H11DRAFT_2233038 [Mycena galericulata]